jgi:hypothetical protein
MVLLALLLVASRPVVAQPPAALSAFLQSNIGLTRDQIAAVERGNVFVKVLPSSNDRDIAVFGIVPVDVPRAAYAAALKDFKSSLVAPTRTVFGILSEPPVAADLQRLVVSNDEASDLSGCKPGDCAMKLPIGDMQYLREKMPWKTPRLSAEVSAYARKRFLEYVLDYRARGDDAMAIFADRGNISAKTAFNELLGDSPYIFEKTPTVAKYLTAYPSAKVSGATEVFFWSEDALPRLRPIISITHEVVLTPAERPSVTVIAAKQIYANHYFEAGIDITLLSDRPLPGGKTGSYLLTLRRYRFDKLPGGILNIKGKATEALRDQLAADLTRNKANAERGRQPD